MKSPLMQVSNQLGHHYFKKFRTLIVNSRLSLANDFGLRFNGRRLQSSALYYGFSQALTLEIELMVFWSEPEDSGMRHAELRRVSPRGTETSPVIFANFIYRVSVRVDLNDIQHDSSWILGGDTADNRTWDELPVAKQGAFQTIHFDTVTTNAETHSGGGTAPTNCQLILQRAIEGRITLTEQERGKWN